MKSLLITIAFLTSMSACTKKCENLNPRCSEKEPTTELCLAVFERWFYNEKTNKCEQISYSGCSKLGFETKVECEECECH